MEGMVMDGVRRRRSEGGEDLHKQTERAGERWNGGRLS